ncbi:MAG: hypothetical protein ABSA41_11300 [Terriglobia bacterium]
MAIVNPQRRMACTALVPEHSFTLDHRQGVEMCAAGTNAIQGSFVVSQGGTPQDDSGGHSRDTPLEYSTVGGITRQAVDLVGGALRCTCSCRFGPLQG